MEKNLNYSDFKSRILTTKRLYHQHFLDILGDKKYYTIVAPEGQQILYICNINEIENSSDVNDYETNFIDGNNGNNAANKQFKLRSSAGAEIVATTFDDTLGLFPKKKMYKHSVIGGDINFFDIEVINEKEICGGEYWITEDAVSKVHEDDYIEFSVIDKNDVLGFFGSYGLTIGEDIIELTKFVKTDYVKKGNISNGYLSDLTRGIMGTNTLYTGLFMRVMYESSGVETTNDVKFMWRMYYYE